MREHSIFPADTDADRFRDARGHAASTMRSRVADAPQLALPGDRICVTTSRRTREGDGMKILCATDLLPKSEAAVERAGMIAQQLGAELSVVHTMASVRGERALDSKAHDALLQMRRRFRPPHWQHDRAPTIWIRTGRVAAELLDILHRTRPSLVVLGPGHQHRMRDRLRGTIADKVVTTRCCPTLIVRREASRPYGKVLLALDLSPAAPETLAAAQSLVLRHSTDAQVIHAFEPDYRGIVPSIAMEMDDAAGANSPERHAAEKALRTLLSRHADQCIRYEVMLSPAIPLVAILRAVRRLQPDLLVLGTSGHGRFRRALLGSVAIRVMERVSCDVLLVPQDLAP